MSDNPLAALVMRERDAAMIETNVVETRFDGSRVVVPSLLAKDDQHHRSLAKAIRALPTTFTNDELLAAAMQLPEVRALVEAADDLNEAISATDRFGDRSLTITGPTANLKWLINASDDTLAALAPFTKGAS